MPLWPSTQQLVGIMLMAALITATTRKGMSTRRLIASAAASEVRLGKVWASVVEVMLCGHVASRNVHLTPSKPDASAGSLPRLFGTHTIFALTAFDPPNEERTLKANTAANAELWKAINRMAPKPAHVWPTWGYNLDEGWREDGFALAYPRAAGGGSGGDAPRAAVVELASTFKQGAIFEFSPGPSEDSLVRTTVPALSSSVVKEVVTVYQVPPDLPPEPAMLQRPWAGPKAAMAGW